MHSRRSGGIHSSLQAAFLPHWGAAAAALVAAVIGIAALMEPSAPETVPLSIATLNIDDVLVEEAGLALGQENLVDALCVLSSTETGVISSDNIQDLLL